MTPTPQELTHCQQNESLLKEDGEKIVISGMSGIYPKCHNVNELSDILYNKVNPVTSEECQWNFKHPESSNFTGVAPNKECFDAQFFKVNLKMGNCMDPMSRKNLELAYEALYDAGINPISLKGKKVGVFVSAALSEMEYTGTYNTVIKQGLGILGCSKTMLSNRISYWLDTKGPSLTYDAACSGSTEALKQAYSAMSRGECEAAFVGGANFCMLPQTMVNYKRCIDVAPEGKTKCFDENADGCAISEAVSMVFLQKAKDALRVYGEVVHVKCEFISKLSDETGQIFGFVRDPSIMADFLKGFYDEARVSPQAVEYIEAFGSATPKADKTELEAIEKVFCDNRTDPLMIGSVMSNIGFTAAASGATALTKVLLGYHTGKIASNLHCETPRRDVAALRDGRMQVLTEHAPTKYGYIGINSMSVTGISSHILLKGHFKPRDLSRYKSSIPRLVTISARQDENLKYIFNDLTSRPIDSEELALLNNIHSEPITGHLGRGYIILNADKENNTNCLKEVVEHRDDFQRPLWFVYSGMGSQWAGMGSELMRIPIFAAAIERCDKVLKPLGIDIVDIITTKEKSTFDNVQNSFLGISAIQIGLTDILRELGLYPDKIIGHSVGELGCAYADGCLTADQMIMVAYVRGKVSNENIKYKNGAMAAVGLGYDKISEICPPEIDIACHNSSNSCTISGPAEYVQQFVTKLTSDGIFAKQVPSSNIAYHSRYISEAGPHIKKYLQDIVKVPKLRSEKWISTTIPEDKWNENKYCSADYLTTNLLNPVLFEEASKKIQSNAVLVEIAPHGLLQAILKRSLPECINIPLTKRGHTDNVTFLLDAIGKLYVEGYNPKIQKLYPKVEFPVSTGTPHLSHFVKWMHIERWTLPTYENNTIKKSAQCNFVITLLDDEYKYLEGNIIQGKVLYPFAGALVAVWDTLLMSNGLPKRNNSVQFRDVHFFSQPILHEQRKLTLAVSLHRINGSFEVLDGKSKVASGFVTLAGQNKLNKNLSNVPSDLYEVYSEEIYQEFLRRGYSYKDAFKSLHSVNEDLKKGQIVWDNNWITFIDGILQLDVLNHEHSGMIQPTQIRDLTIDVLKHKSCLETLPDGKTVVNTEINDVLERITSGGVVVHNIKSNKTIEYPEQLKFNLFTPAQISTDTNNNLNQDIEILNIETLVRNNVPAALKGSLKNIETLRWEEAPELPNKGVNVQVYFSGVNTYDMKRATGIISTKCNDYGMDFSGTTDRGERVMGLVKTGAISTLVKAQPELTWPIPQHWTLQDAATVPLAYAQAFYCMCIKYDLKRNQNVLIHGGAGALGQAAISIAFAYGCKVFTTVSDVSKKRFLLRMFPQLNENDIGNSRDDSFGDMVLSATNGEGCNLILSCVQGNLKNKCLNCVASYGLVIDLTQLQHLENFTYGMSHMVRSRSYKVVDFNSLFEPSNANELKVIHRLISDGISRGYVRPLSRVTYAAHEAPRAFRLLAASKHRGRVLLSLAGSSTCTENGIACKPGNSHLILWDSDSFGLHLAEKLISRGATKLLLHCSNSSLKCQLKLRAWSNVGVTARVLSGNIDNDKDMLLILQEAQELGPMEGIYIETKAKNFTKISSLLLLLEKYLRQLTSSTLKYSGIINVYDQTIRENQIRKLTDRLPITVLNIPDIQNVKSQLQTSFEDYTWSKAAVTAFEQAITNKNLIVNAKPDLMELPSLNQQIIKLIGKDKAIEFNDQKTLKDLRLDPSVLDVIKTYLETVLNVSFEHDDILMLNENEIQQLESLRRNETEQETKGLSTLFSYVDPDELLATTDIVAMDTLLTDTASIGIELITDNTYMCIVPGIEGHHSKFRGLCERLKLPAFVLQPGLDHINETPHQLATRYSKVLLNKMGLKKTFILLGYEYGVVVALELAAILEKHGLVGIVFCIGQDPEVFRSQIDEITKEHQTEELLKLGLAQHLFSLMARGEKIDHKTIIDSISWEQDTITIHKKIDFISQSAQYLRAVIEAAYARIKTIRTYKVTPRVLKSKIVLLCTNDGQSSNSSSLKNYSTPEFVKYDLSMPLAQFAQDLRCANLINRHLPDDVLEIFNSSNLCHSYVVNKSTVLF